MLAICTEDSYFVLKYNSAAVAAYVLCCMAIFRQQQLVLSGLARH